MDTISLICLIVSGSFALLLAIRLGYKLFGGKIRTVPAKVINKHTMDFYARHAPGQTRVRYIVTFEVGSKTKAFTVSGTFYSGVRIGETGTLTHKGDRVITFE